MDDRQDDQRRSRTLFHLLTVSMQLGTKGFKLIKNIQDTNGFEAWRQLIG